MKKKILIVVILVILVTGAIIFFYGTKKGNDTSLKNEEAVLEDEDDEQKDSSTMTNQIKSNPPSVEQVEEYIGCFETWPALWAFLVTYRKNDDVTYKYYALQDMAFCNGFANVKNIENYQEHELESVAWLLPEDYQAAIERIFAENIQKFLMAQDVNNLDDYLTNELGMESEQSDIIRLFPPELGGKFGTEVDYPTRTDIKVTINEDNPEWYDVVATYDFDYMYDGNHGCVVKAGYVLEEAPDKPYGYVTRDIFCVDGEKRINVTKDSAYYGNLDDYPMYQEIIDYIISDQPVHSDFEKAGDSKLFSTDDYCSAFVKQYKKIMHYCLFDMDNDGSCELLIGPESGGSFGAFICDLYTLKNNKIVHLYSGRPDGAEMYPLIGGQLGSTYDNTMANRRNNPYEVSLFSFDGDKLNLEENYKPSPGYPASTYNNGWTEEDENYNNAWNYIMYSGLELQFKYIYE